MRSAASVVLRDVARAGGKLEVLGRGGAGVQTPTQRCRTTSRRARPPPPPLLLPAPLFTESRAIAPRQPKHTHTHTTHASHLLPLPSPSQHKPCLPRPRPPPLPPPPPRPFRTRSPSLPPSLPPSPRRVSRCAPPFPQRLVVAVGMLGIGQVKVLEAVASAGAARQAPSEASSRPSRTFHPSIIRASDPSRHRQRPHLAGYELELTSRPFSNRSTPAT